MRYQSPKIPNYTFDFASVNVILGANGSGKSQFLSELRDAIPKINNGAKAVYIEGGRAIKIQDVIRFDARNFQKYDKLETALSQYEQKRLSSLADRVFDAIVVLEKKELQLKSKHSDEVEKWNEDGQSGDFPKRPIAPLSRVFELFSEIFPQITLSFDYQARRLSAEKNGQVYGPSMLSDGEKQVFSVLADLVELDELHEVIIADEPELNLHPELAERLWTLLENEFLGKTFIYATHSINFALREGVDRVYILGSEPDKVTEFESLDTLPRQETAAFLGGLPGILSANKVIVTEGHEKSFDALFYRWVLGDGKLEIYPAGGCTDVISVVTKSGLWEKISTRVSLIGVIDSDYKSDDYEVALGQHSVVVLPTHEAEAYLCHPDIACAIAERIGSQESLPSKLDIESKIFEALESSSLAIAARRVFAKSTIALRVSLERNVLAAVESRNALVERIRTASGDELAKAVDSIGAAEVERKLDQELERIAKTIRKRDLQDALKLVPSKELLNAIAPKTGCKNGMDMMRSLKKNFSPDDFDSVSNLRNLLRSGL